MIGHAVLVCGLYPACAMAQRNDGKAPQALFDAIAAHALAAPAAPRGLSIPALTPVKLEILKPLGSRISKTGDTFPIRLAAAIMIDGREAIPAGVTGMGEVVHAKKSGGSGAAGELVLAARYLDVGGQQLRLRSLRLLANGQSLTGAVTVASMASSVSPIPFGLLGLFIPGGQANIPQGTIADAKTAQPFTLSTEAPTPTQASASMTALADTQISRGKGRHNDNP